MVEPASFGGVKAATRDAIKRIFACAPSNLEVTPSSTSSSILTDQFHDSQDAGMSDLSVFCALYGRLPPVNSRRLKGRRMSFAPATARMRFVESCANEPAIDLCQDP